MSSNIIAVRRKAASFLPCILSRHPPKSIPCTLLDQSRTAQHKARAHAQHWHGLTWTSYTGPTTVIPVALASVSATQAWCPNPENHPEDFITKREKYSFLFQIKHNSREISILKTFKPPSPIWTWLLLTHPWYATHLSDRLATAGEGNNKLGWSNYSNGKTKSREKAGPWVYTAHAMRSKIKLLTLLNKI